MAKTVEFVRVTLASDNFYPQAFRWGGRSIRILFVEGMRTTGAERLFRVRTSEGAYELVQQTVTQVWTLRRRPSWWDRAFGQGVTAARYEPAMGRKRISRAEAREQFARAQEQARTQGAAKQHAVDGGEHASGFAVVR
jgi:hypothetical protein